MIAQRLDLAAGRVAQIPGETGVMRPEFEDFFHREAGFILLVLDERRFLGSSESETADEAVLAARNRKLYEDILPENYKSRYTCPDYACEKLGETYGPLLSALAFEMRSMIPYVYCKRDDRMVIRLELFLEIYGEFVQEYRDEKIPSPLAVRNRIRLYLGDYASQEQEFSVGDRLAGDETAFRDVLAHADPSDLRYLYRIGEYVSDNERGLAALMASLPQETADRMADTYTEGFRMGFIAGGKDLASKKTVELRANIGFLRMMQKAAANFSKMGLQAAVPCAVPSLFRMSGGRGDGAVGGNANPQYYYDHKEDLALFLDDELEERFLEALDHAYKAYDGKTQLYAGPAVVETFGEKPFSPAATAHAQHFHAGQQRISADYRSKAAAMYDRAVVGKNRSFTIISFPVPEIADSEERYREIFRAVIDINTLDSNKYRDIQQVLIDTLNTAQRVHVVGKGENRTDLTVCLYHLTDPARQTIFENCVADVNIPVGEVFTTPVLKGTEGRLHVSHVYLEGLEFKDLVLDFKDGRVVDYSCAGFETPQEGRRYIEDNILYHNKLLPMGECAIGTNTTAYAAARKYGIEDRLNILIAEKTGPHFAVGDTCYSHEEDNRVYNPDGKEIMAKDNEVSCLRKSAQPQRAYFGCHTDITIPFDELGSYTAVRSDGSEIPLILDGRFVLPGTEALNEALDTQ